MLICVVKSTNTAPHLAPSIDQVIQIYAGRKNKNEKFILHQEPIMDSWYYCIKQ